MKQETRLTIPTKQCLGTWNQKNLDYEIETKALADRVGMKEQYIKDLKSKEPRLRDWN